MSRVSSLVAALLAPATKVLDTVLDTRLLPSVLPRSLGHLPVIAPSILERIRQILVSHSKSPVKVIRHRISLSVWVLRLSSWFLLSQYKFVLLELVKRSRLLRLKRESSSSGEFGRLTSLPSPCWWRSCRRPCQQHSGSNGHWFCISLSTLSRRRFQNRSVQKSSFFCWKVTSLDRKRLKYKFESGFSFHD